MPCIDDQQWVHLPLHSSIEAFGVAILIILSIYVLKFKNPPLISERAHFISAGLVATGIFEAFHALIYPGNNFVWLHSAATFCGGLFFVAAFSPLGRFVRLKEQYYLPLIVAAISVIAGTVSILFPNLVPQMLINCNFTYPAKILNITGGGLFIWASFCLIASFLNNRAIEVLIFSAFCFFMGLAGIIFIFSSLWGPTWWFWHFLRFTACLIVLGFVFFLYRNSQDNLRKSEQKIKNFMLYANEGFILCDKNFNFLEINNKALQIFPHGTTKENLLGQNILDFAPTLKKSGRYDQYLDVIKTGNPLKIDNITADHLGDKHISINAFKVDNGLGMIFSDISAQIKSAEEKETLENQLRQSQKMEAIGTLAGGIAHDFNNILAIILGYAEMAYEEIQQQKFPLEYLERISTAGRRAKELVRQILTFSRKDNTIKQPVMMDLVVNEAIKMLRSSLPATIKITTTINNDCGKIMADPTNLYQIIINLCSNAQYAMEQNGTLTIELFRRNLNDHEIKGPENQPGGAYVVLSIGDTGSGMDTATIERIFEPFFTTKPVNSGTGLGLSVIHGIVTDLNGFISVESKSGQGSLFKIFFPALENTAPEPQKTEKEEPLPTGNEQILIIDDESSIIEVMEMMLGRLGYKVHGISESPRALELIRADPARFDLIITDQSMPNLSGAELAQEVKKINPNLPIILCSGYSSVMDKEKAKAIGIKNFLIKPVGKEKLAHVVRETLNSALKS